LLPATEPLLRIIVPYDLFTRLAAARAGGDPAAFDRGLAEGQAWDIVRVVAAGLRGAEPVYRAFAAGVQGRAVNWKLRDRTGPGSV
jgi:hypothetical protein